MSPQQRPPPWPAPDRPYRCGKVYAIVTHQRKVGGDVTRREPFFLLFCLPVGSEVPTGPNCRAQFCIDTIHTSLYCSCTHRRLFMASRIAAQHRDEVINLRANQTQRTLIDCAAEAVGKNRTEFMLEAACREAGSVLSDRRYFVLDENTYKRFTEALDRRPADNPKLRRLLRSKAPWDR